MSIILKTANYWPCRPKNLKKKKWKICVLVTDYWKFSLEYSQPPIQRLWRQTFTVMKWLMIHTLLSEPVKGTLGHRPQKQHEVTPSLTHIFTAIQPWQTEQSFRATKFTFWSLVFVIYPFQMVELLQASPFRCEALNDFQSQGVKSLFSISRSSVETDARADLRVPIVSKHVCAQRLISFSSSTCSH